MTIPYNYTGPTLIGNYDYYVSVKDSSQNLFNLKILQNGSSWSLYTLTGGINYVIKLWSQEVKHMIELKGSTETDSYSNYNYTLTPKKTTKYLTPESCKNSSLTWMVLFSFWYYQTYQVNECYKERWFWNNNMYFHIVSKTEANNPSKIIYPLDVIDKSGAVRQLSFINKRNDLSFYIPYDTWINCDDYREWKTAVKDRNYFDVVCDWCGKFNWQDVTWSIVTWYATQWWDCNYKIFYCPVGASSWDPSSDVSSYPYLSCNKDCVDWRNGTVWNKLIHWTVITWYVSSTSSNCLWESKAFTCNNWTWSDFTQTPSYRYHTCGTVVVTWACNPSTNWQNLFSYPSANKCSTYASIIDDDAVWNDGVFNWRCMWTGGWADQACSADRVYSWYTCQFDSYDNPVWSWILVWRSAWSLGKPLSSTWTNYNIWYSINAINAWSYVCVANAQCGSANANLVTSYPDVHTLCERSKYIVNNDTDWTDWTYNWTCAWFAWAASNVACSATKVAVVNWACGSASGLNFSVEPSDSQLCTSGSTVNKTVSWNSTSYNSIFSWSCNGTWWWTNASCNLNKVYPYHQYQCQLSWKIALNWMPINYPNNGSGSYSPKLNYGSGNYVYASPISGDPYYVWAYVCRASGVCGDADGTYSYDEPSNMDCKIWKYTYYWDQWSYWYWTCGGINWWASSSCYVYKSEDATCGEANGKTYVEEPDESYLCGVYDSIYKYYDVSYGYIDYWTDFSNNETARWLCAGLQWWEDAWCSATRKHYTRYQCKFQNSRLERVPDSTTDLNPSIKKTYYLSDYIYASHIPRSTNYVGWYPCQCPVWQTFDSVKWCFTPVQPVNWACWSAKDTPTVKAPTNNLCAQWNSSSITPNTNTYNWTCVWVNSWTNAQCSVARLSVVTWSCWTPYYACTAWTSISNSISFDDKQWTWTCTGANGWADTSCAVCRSNYHLSGGVCVSDIEAKTWNCNALSVSNSERNTVSSYTQSRDWNNNSRSAWSPADDATTEYSDTQSTTSCRYKCSNGYWWNGNACVLVSYPGYTCTYQWSAVWQPLEYPSYTKSPTGTYKYGSVIYTDNTAWYTCDPKEDGRCWSATGTVWYNFPTTNLCSWGSVSSTGTYPSSFVWQCNGINGSTTNVACSANRKRDGVCGPSNGMQINIPWWTEQNVKDALAASSGLCKYSYDTRTAASITLNSSTNSATWSCTPINGWTTASCTGTYSIYQVKCASKDIYLSNNYVPKEYYNIPQITKWSYWSGSSFSYSQVWTDNANNKITTVTKNYLVTGNFTCIDWWNPTLNSEISTLVSVSTGYKCVDGYIVSGTVSSTTPTSSTQTCAKICDDSDANMMKCGAWRTIYMGSSPATYKPDYTLDCYYSSNSEHTSCPTTCPAGKYRWWSSVWCISTPTTCNNASSSCNNWIRTWYDTNNSCWPTWQCYNGNYSSPISIATDCKKTWTALQYRNGYSFENIVCIWPFGGYIYWVNHNYTMSIWYGKSRTCNYACGWGCDVWWVFTESACYDSCSDGYQANWSYCCPKICEAWTASNIKVNIYREPFDWTQSETYQFGDYSYTLKIYGYEYQHTSGDYCIAEEAKNWDMVWVREWYWYDKTTTSYEWKEIVKGQAYNPYIKVDWNNQNFDWDTSTYYLEDKSEDLDPTRCNDSSDVRTLYYVSDTLQEQQSFNWINKVFADNSYVWIERSCKLVTKTTRSYMNPCAQAKAYADCKDFQYSNGCPSWCSVSSKCYCPNGWEMVNGKCQWKWNMYQYYLQWGWGDADGTYGTKPNDDPACNVWPSYNSIPSGWIFILEAPYRKSDDSCYVDRLIGKSRQQRNYKKFYRSFILNVWDPCRVWMKASDLGKSNIDNGIQLCLWDWGCWSYWTIDSNWDCK